MAQGGVRGRETSDDRPSPCYVFYGEETYYAEKFIGELRSRLLGPDDQPFNLERFDLGEASWAEILDIARTAPFLFTPWRIVSVTAREDSRAKLAPADEALLREYCRAPAEKTVLVVVVPGKGKKTHPLVKLLGSLPSGVEVRPELKSPRWGDLVKWISRGVAASGKVITQEGAEKLAEIVGSDLRRVDLELEKLVTYVSARRVIDIQDVLDICDWGRTFAEWELVDNLEKADYRTSLLILSRRFTEGAQPEYIMGSIAGLLRDVLLARLWLRENRDKKEIFASLKPRVPASHYKFQEIFQGFFALVEGFSDAELDGLIDRLKRIDILIKSSDVPAKAMIEGFIFDYCRLRRRIGEKKRLTSGRRG